MQCFLGRAPVRPEQTFYHGGPPRSSADEDASRPRRGGNGGVSFDNEEIGKEILWKMNRIIRTSASCLIVVLFARLSYAQQAACKISPLRGATSPAGAEGAMFVINNGRPCRYSVYEHPAQRRNPGARGEITLPPKHGTVELSPRASSIRRCRDTAERMCFQCKCGPAALMSCS